MIVWNSHMKLMWPTTMYILNKVKAYHNYTEERTN